MQFTNDLLDKISLLPVSKWRLVTQCEMYPSSSRCIFNGCYLVKLLLELNLFPTLRPLAVSLWLYHQFWLEQLRNQPVNITNNHFLQPANIRAIYSSNWEKEMNTDVMAKTRLLLAQLFLKTESTYTFGINDHRALVIESTLFTIFGVRISIPLHSPILAKLTDGDICKKWIFLVLLIFMLEMILRNMKF